MAPRGGTLLGLVIASLACCTGCGGRVTADEQAQPIDAGESADVWDEPDTVVQPDGMADAHSSADSAGPVDLVLFLTAGRWRGLELGGLAGADAKCNQEGDGLGGPFVAVLSAQGISARQRMPAGRLFNVSGVLLQEDADDFFQLQDYSAKGIAVDLDSKGNPVKGYNPGEVAWWGSDEHGMVDCGSCCDDWAGGSNMDAASAIDPELGLVGSSPGCLIGNPVRLICVGPRKK